MLRFVVFKSSSVISKNKKQLKLQQPFLVIMKFSLLLGINKEKKGLCGFLFTFVFVNFICLRAINIVNHLVCVCIGRA